jgi:hypothetical protein
MNRLGTLRTGLKTLPATGCAVLTPEKWLPIIPPPLA